MESSRPNSRFRPPYKRFENLSEVRVDMREVLNFKRGEKQLEENYPNSGSDLRMADKRISRLREKLIQKEDEIDNFKKENSEMKKKITYYKAALEEKCAKMEILDEKLAAESEEICKLENDLRDVNFQLYHENEEKLRLEEELSSVKIDLGKEKQEKLHLQNELLETQQDNAELKNTLEGTEKETSRLRGKLSRMESDKEKLEADVGNFHDLVSNLKSACSLNEINDDIPINTQLEAITEKLARHFEAFHTIKELVQNVQTPGSSAFRAQESAFHPQNCFTPTQQSATQPDEIKIECEEMPELELEEESVENSIHTENTAKRKRLQSKTIYYCTCDAEFSDKEAMASHFQQKDKGRKFQCIQCPKRFEFLYNLKRHLTGTHGMPEALKEFQVGCRFCGGMFETREQHCLHTQHCKEAKDAKADK